MCTAASTPEDELWDVTARLGDERDRQIIVRRFGWNGKAPRTLESIGKLYVMTRQRVHQLCARVKHVQKPEPFLPVLDRVIKTVEAVAPIRVHDVEDELRRRGLTRTAFPLETVLDIAQRFGRKPRFSIVRGKVRRVTG